MKSTAAAVIGGVDTHADVHGRSGVRPARRGAGHPVVPDDHRGLPPAAALAARTFGDLTVVGVEGTGSSYGVGLTRFLLEAGVELREVLRPNRQVRRRNGKTDVVDAIAAARAVLSGEASAPKSHDGAVEALRALKIVHRSAHKSRT
jgi:transposase